MEAESVVTYNGVRSIGMKAVNRSFWSPSRFNSAQNFAQESPLKTSQRLW